MQPKDEAEGSAHKTLGEIGARLRASNSYSKVASRAQNLASALQHTAAGWAARLWSAPSTVEGDRRPSDSVEIEARTTMLHRRIEEMAESLQDGSAVVDEQWLLDFTETHQQYMESCSIQGVDFNVLGSTEDFLQFVLLNPKVQAVLRKLEGHEDMVVTNSSAKTVDDDHKRVSAVEHADPESPDTCVSQQSRSAETSESCNFSPNSRVELDDSADETAGLVVAGESILTSIPAPEIVLSTTKSDEPGVKQSESDEDRAVSLVINGTMAENTSEALDEPEYDETKLVKAACLGLDDGNDEQAEEMLHHEESPCKQTITASSENRNSEDMLQHEPSYEHRITASGESKQEVTSEDMLQHKESSCEHRITASGESKHELTSEEMLQCEGILHVATTASRHEPTSEDTVDTTQVGVDMETMLSSDGTPSTGNRFGVQLRRNNSTPSEKGDGDQELLAKLEARRQQMAKGGALSPRSRRAASASDADEDDFDGPIDGNFAGMTMQQKMAARRKKMEQIG